MLPRAQGRGVGGVAREWTGSLACPLSSPYCSQREALPASQAGSALLQAPAGARHRLGHPPSPLFEAPGPFAHLGLTWEPSGWDSAF